MSFLNRADAKKSCHFMLAVLFVVFTASCSGPIKVLKTPQISEKTIHPRDRLHAYDKKIGKVLSVGRCMANGSRSIQRFLEYTSLDRPALMEKFEDLGKRQEILDMDRRRIRDVIYNTTASPQKLVQPFSHLQPYADLWFESITPNDWRAIDERYDQHISFLYGMAAMVMDYHDEIFLQDPDLDRSSLLKPMFCSTILETLLYENKLDHPLFFERELLHNTLDDGVRETRWKKYVPNFFAGSDLKIGGTGDSHVKWVNRLGAYQDSCDCYRQAQQKYKKTGARFFRQSQVFGDLLCESLEDQEVANLESYKREHISAINERKSQPFTKRSDLLDFFKTVKPNLTQEERAIQYQQNLQRYYVSFVNVARAQFADSMKNQEQSSLQYSRDAMVCLYNARAKMRGNQYLAADYVQYEKEN